MAMHLRIEGSQWACDCCESPIPDLSVFRFHMKGPYEGTPDAEWEVWGSELLKRGKTPEDLRSWLIMHNMVSATELIDGLNTWIDSK